MSAITGTDEFIDHTTAMALEERAKLKKHFTRFDIYFFLICTIVGVDTLGVVAAEGAQGFTWLIFLAVAFFVPYALIVAELGSAFPEEGGSYVWTRLAFGQARGGRQRRLLLVQQPDLDRGHARPPDDRDRRPVLLLDRRQLVAVLPRRARVHLVLGLLGDPLVRDRQVDPDTRRVGSHLRARAVRDQHDPLRDQERPQPAAGRRVQADLRAVHRARAGAVLQLRRLRAAERCGRRDERSPEGRAVHRPPRGRHRDPALRSADPRRDRRAPEGADHRRRRLHDRGRIGVHRLRRRRERDDEDRRMRIHPRAHLERLHVADGLRPQPGRGLLRRRRAARPRPLLGEAGHARQRQLPLGRDLDDRLRRRGEDRQRQRLGDLRRDDRDRPDVHDDLVHRDLPGPDQAALQPPARASPVQDPRWDGRRLDLRRRLHVLGAVRVARRDLPGLCRRSSC